MHTHVRQREHSHTMGVNGRSSSQCNHVRLGGGKTLCLNLKPSSNHTADISCLSPNSVVWSEMRNPLLRKNTVTDGNQSQIGLKAGHLRWLNLAGTTTSEMHENIINRKASLELTWFFDRDQAGVFRHATNAALPCGSHLHTFTDVRRRREKKGNTMYTLHPM